MSAAKSDLHTAGVSLCSDYARKDMTDQEREQHIQRCGRGMLGAHNRGDKQAAEAWRKLQTEAIKQRTPKQVLRMDACYFVTQGNADREMMVL